MKKILIVGAGAQGGPCASILSREKDMSEIVLGDIDLELTKKAKEKIKSDKIIPIKLDAGNVDDVTRAAKGVDVIINLTLTEFDMPIMKAALNSGVHYVDTSFGEPSLMDIQARDNILAQIIEKRPLSFDKEFKNAGLTALLGCGTSPGTTNVIARYICDKLDRVEEMCIRLGSKSLEPSKEVVRGWAPTWSPFRALWGYAVEPTIFENGQYKKYPIFSCPEEYAFPDPLGPVLLTYHQHQESITLPYFIGKGMKYCAFKYPVDPAAGAFVKMGFGSPDPIDLKGVKVVPRDVLLKFVRPPVNAFFSEDENSVKQPINRMQYIVVEAKGTQSGKEVKYIAATPSNFIRTTEERIKVYKKLGTTIISVALPAAVGAKMCVKGNADKGVISSECLDPKTFLKMIAETGAPLKLNETLIKDEYF